MAILTIKDIVTFLGLSISPVILISGGGLLLLCMTNRFGRIIDRSRSIAEFLRSRPGEDPHNYKKQLKVLVRRARLVRLSIACTSIGLLFIALLVIAIFFAALMSLDWGGFIVFLFIIGMIFIIFGLISFIVDIEFSLVALKIETEF